MLPRFNPLTDGGNTKSGGHFHQLGQDNPASLALVQTFHKGHIKFDEVKPDALEHVQGRVTASKIVHPNLEPLCPEAVNLFLDIVKIAADKTFCNLNTD